MPAKEKAQENTKEAVKKPEAPVVAKQETRRPGPVLFDLTTPKVDGSLTPKMQREQLDDDFEFEFINIDE